MPFVEIKKKKMSGNEAYKKPTTDDESEDSIGKRSSVIKSAPVKPPVRSRPSFITNREYVPNLLVFATFAFLTFGVQWLVVQNPTAGFAAAVIVLVFMAEWERRARYSFGRVRQRAHFDQLSLVRLPTPHIPPNLVMEPSTPWISQNETVRTDAATILKRAQDTIGAGGQAESGAQSAIELALVNLLKSAAAQKSTGQPSESEKPPPETKGPEPAPVFNKGPDAPPPSPISSPGSEPPVEQAPGSPVVNDQPPPPPPPS